MRPLNLAHGGRMGSWYRYKGLMGETWGDEGKPMRTHGDAVWGSMHWERFASSVSLTTPSWNRSCTRQQKAAWYSASGSCSRSTPSTRYRLVALK